tara:strand:- start:999 stop:1325 length:327 start_codon:yes stop_codon:yes gene_type:complete
MKKIAYLSILISLLITPLSAVETQDCSDLKKLSRAFMNCKQHNIKTAIINAGKSVKQNTTDKIKSEPGKKVFDTGKIAVVASEKKKAISNKFKNIFSGSTKQYPKGTK